MGRGAPCFPIRGMGEGLPVLVVQPAAGLIGLLPVVGSTVLGKKIGDRADTYRSTPNFNILGFTATSGIVKGIFLDEVAGFSASVIRIVLNNYNNRWGKTALAKEQSSFKATFGYDNPGQFSHGTFVVQKPQFRYEAGEGPATVEIVGYGESVKLGATERREIYRKKSDSNIAEQIAARNGFGADIETTTPVYDQVIQANESDWKFLERRAKLYGYMLYVEDSVLHFHRVRPRESGISVAGGDIPGALQSFTAQSRTFMRGLSLTMTQIDPVTKDEISVQSTEAPDDLQARLDYKNWVDMVSIKGVGQPKRFIVGEGHKQTTPELTNMIDQMAKASRYVIMGSGVLHGIESLRANDIIEVNGIGRSSGKYYVTRALHSIDSGEGGGYRVKFEVVRAGAGILTTPGRTTVEPQSAGTVTF